MHDQTGRIANGMSTRRTSRHHRMVRAFEPIADRHLTRDQVDQSAGHKEGRHTAGTFLFHHNGGVGDGVQTTNARADQNTGTLQALGIVRGPSRILNRLLGGGHAEHDKGVDLTLFLGLHVFVRIKGAVRPVAQRYFAGIGRDQPFGVKAGDRPRTGLAVQNTFPTCFDPIGQRGHKTQTCHNHSAHVLMPPCYLCASYRAAVTLFKPRHTRPVLRATSRAGRIKHRVRRQALRLATPADQTCGGDLRIDRCTSAPS
mmetsp:Transcript_29164/g.56280  ORF Transcript_29164/g.56280 Transcript_29164/m.56280 type:complete len:257 (+) Transcript_29164:2006-2776(+)